jgi:hypothetical protein
VWQFRVVDVDLTGFYDVGLEFLELLRTGRIYLYFMLNLRGVTVFDMRRLDMRRYSPVESLANKLQFLKRAAAAVML